MDTTLCDIVKFISEIGVLKKIRNMRAKQTLIQMIIIDQESNT